MRCEPIICWSKAGGSFIAGVPELPGCMADDASHEEAVANAQAVIQGWMDTARSLSRPIPEPRGKLPYACHAGIPAMSNNQTVPCSQGCGSSRSQFVEKGAEVYSKA